MAFSSITGADRAPTRPRGRDAEWLGPSDNSDTGSDTVGSHEAHADSDAGGTGARGSVAPNEAAEGADIRPDRVVQAVDGDGLPEADPDSEEFTDLDARELGVPQADEHNDGDNDSGAG